VFILKSDIALIKSPMNFEYFHLLAWSVLFLLLFLFYLSPFELTVNEDDDDE